MIIVNLEMIIVNLEMIIVNLKWVKNKFITSIRILNRPAFKVGEH